MSDEVSQFLEQVERLRGQQIEDDEVRAREREEFLAAKRERQARREERARSISPQKSSPANTPSPRSNRRTVHLSDSLRLESPDPGSVDKLREWSVEPEKVAEADPKPDTMSSYSVSPTKENEAPSDSDVKRNDASTTPSRASGLSWQRRTNRSNSRPLSVVAAQNATQRSLTEPEEPQEPQEPPSPNRPLSKDQIAQRLGSKDPSWFRQTADRGQSSAAYRRNQVEDDDRLDMSSVRAHLPGLSGDNSKEVSRESSSETPRERPTSRSGSNTPAAGRLASPLPLNPPRFENPAAAAAAAAAEKPDSDSVSGTPSGRASPIRSTSPTKGMGGFVQSAMMKRSDSVKRWSVTSPPGLTRADSVAANRGVYDRASAHPSTSRPQSVAREPSTTPGTSRPTSRHGEKETKVVNHSPREDPPKTPTRTSPSLKQSDDDASLPVSPSKTMDARRWSPTKSSWLESALNKPESPPKPQHRSTPSQPAWMVELNKNKADRANNSETGRPAASHKHQVSIGGLMRSTPMGAGLNLNTTGLGGIYSPPSAGPQSATTRAPAQSLNSAQLGPAPEPENPKPDVKAKKIEDSSSSISPPITKSKPEAPPKKDFRSNLKPRSAEAPEGRREEPEFKSVFGTLRKTKTQNFKAPDELKDNILRGKASLNTTDGPQKSAIKDEFKDAILKKKDDFQKAQSEGKGVDPSLSTRNEKPKQIPEGLARRAELGRRMTDPKKESISAPEKREPLGQSKKPDSPRPTPPQRKSSQINLSRQSSPALTPSRSPSADKTRSDSSEHGGTPTPPAESSTEALQSLVNKKSAPSKLGGLADRFNPALAGLLSRGPPPMSSNGGQRAERPAPASGDTEPSKPGPQLTHMTKNRARGPKRKAPSSVGNSPATSTDSLAAVRPSVATGSQSFPSLVEEKKPAPLSIQEQVAAKAATRSSKTDSVRPNNVNTKTTKEAHRPAPLSLRRRPTDHEAPVVESSPPKSPPEAEPDSPRKLDLKRMSRFLDQSNKAKSNPVKEPVKLTHQRTGSRSPVKAMESSLPEPVEEPLKLRRQRTGSSSPVKKSERPLPDPRTSSLDLINGTASAKSPPSTPRGSTMKGPRPMLRKSSREVESREASPRASVRSLPRLPAPTSNHPSPLASPSRIQSADVSAMLHGFFGPSLERKAFDIDPAEILTNYPKFAGKIKTLSFHIFQISGDGKQTQLPAHHERVLFEQEMYVAAHNFTNEAGWKVREVYFWVGDEVADADIQVAESVAQQEAKSLGGKLLRIGQGKETPEFVQALGGVVIVRRGSGNKYDSLAPVMLCGRRYMGQVAFDQVDFGTASLCAGFAYLITHSGNCYLWKGKGSDVDELGCARLIGMDLALTGQLIEYDEGSEPASFWKLLDGGSKPHSADHWRLKPSYGKYCSRLFCSDANSRQQIYEISPFNQGDMSPSGIYILDAFFEMYIIVGSHAQSQYASFRNALEFAQEYAVLAASMEDRPFIPISTVVLEGAPRDFKRVFRKWSDERCPTILNVAPPPESGLKRGRSLRVVPLTQAILALKE